MDSIFDIGQEYGDTPIAPPTFHFNPVAERENYDIPAPSQEIVAGLTKTFNPKTVWDVPLGLIQAGVNVFGLPQEGVTRVLSKALTGTEYATPGEAIGQIGPLPESITDFAANVVLDPLNIAFGVGGMSKVLNGGFKATQVLKRAAGFDELVVASKQGYLFHRQEDLLKVLNEAKVNVPIIKDAATGLYTPRFEDLINPDREKALIDSILKKKNITEIDDIDFVIKPWSQNPGKFNFKEKLFIQKFLGTPSRWSDFTKSVIDSLNDAGHTRSLYHQENAKFFEENFMDFKFHQRTKNPLNRALYYEVFDQHEMYAKDNRALRAAQDYGDLQLKEKANLMKRFFIKDLQRLTPEAISYIMDKESENMIAVVRSLGENLDKANFQYSIPDKAKEYILHKKHVDNIHQADIAQVIQDFGLRLSKDAYLKPTVASIQDSLRRVEVTSKIGPKELDLVQSLLRMQTGQISEFDKQVAATILGSKEKIRSWSRALKMEAAAERLIHDAREGRSFSTQLSVAARKTTYASLLGGAIDSALRNLTGTLNTMVEFGVRKTLENVSPVMKATIDYGKEQVGLKGRWHKELGLENIMTKSNSYLTELYENTNVGQGRSFMDLIMLPMNMTEFFNRGLAFTTALNEYSSNGAAKTIGEAIQMAEDAARKLQFGYSATDISPYLTGPTARIFMQFQNYPMKMAELLYTWMKEPDKTFKNKFVRWSVLSGALIARSEQLGVNMNDVFGIGFNVSEYPPQFRFGGVGILPEFTLRPPVVKLVESSLTAGKGFLGSLLQSPPLGPAGGPYPSEMTPREAWKGLGDAIRILTPGGRYSAKLTQNLIEWIGVDPDKKGWVENEPIKVLGQLAGVNVDPTIRANDRMLSLLGFRSTNERTRRDQLEFLSNYIKIQRAAVTEINEAVLRGEDHTKIQNYWQKRVSQIYGPKMMDLGVDDDVLINQIKPSDMIYLKRAAARQGATQVEKLLIGFPQQIREAILMSEEINI